MSRTSKRWSSTWKGIEYESHHIIDTVVVYKNGDEYDGDWVNGKAHGNGKSKILPKELFDNRISYYEGEWFEDYLHGKIFSLKM